MVAIATDYPNLTVWHLPHVCLQEHLQSGHWERTIFLKVIKSNIWKFHMNVRSKHWNNIILMLWSEVWKVSNFHGQKSSSFIPFSALEADDTDFWQWNFSKLEMTNWIPGKELKQCLGQKGHLSQQNHFYIKASEYKGRLAYARKWCHLIPQMYMASQNYILHDKLKFGMKKARKKPRKSRVQDTYSNCPLLFGACLTPWNAKRWREENQTQTFFLFGLNGWR